ncbi:MAG: 4Fe-4S binding protein [Candidatus Micrarchaeota archaeon]|nr:4Fe-4S binding protein [Candidatus Micrarchaeota archaeon]
MQPKINKKICIGCGTCVAVCPAGVFEIRNDKSEVVNPSACVGCKSCVLNCPEGAISFKKK